MIKHHVRLIWFLFLSVSALLLECAGARDEAGGLVVEPSKLEKLDSNRLSLTGGGKRSADAVMSQWSDDAVFLEIAGQDRLTWGLVREQMGEIVLPPHPGATEDEIKDGKKYLFQTKLAKMLRSYIEYGVIAVEARRLGIRISPDECVAEREKVRDYWIQKGRAGERYLRLMEKPESYFEHNLTNALLWRAYSDQVVAPTIQISDEEIADRVKLQHEHNVAAAATNLIKRAQIEDILKKVKGGWLGFGRKVDFSEAARKWSDDDSSETGGELTDADEKTRKISSGELRIEIENAYKKMSPGDISDVIETPYSWHIIKLLARNPGVDGEGETVELAHIMLEKVRIVPEISSEQAREKIMKSRLKEAMKARFSKLLRATKISCLVPLFDKGKGPRTRMVRD